VGAVYFYFYGREESVFKKRFLFIIGTCLFFYQFAALPKAKNIGNQKSCIVITLPADQEGIAEKIKAAACSSFFLERLTYSCDVHFLKREFLYLIGLQELQEVSVDQLLRAIDCLVKKNKFEKITLTLCPFAKGKHLHIDLEGFWEFTKLKLYGILVGKEKYKKYYLLESGDAFNLEKHNHSIEKIKEAFRVDGYFDGKVSSSIRHDHETKAISVHLNLDIGIKFAVRDVAFIFNSSNESLQDELDILQKKVCQQFGKKFLKGGYSKLVINRETRALKKYLSKKGFLHVDIELVEYVDYNSKEIDLKFILDIHSKREFIFFGNSFFSDTQLLDKILLFGQSAWLVPVSILSREIARAYHENGFWNVSVEAKEDPNGYFFIIQEGPRASVKEVDFKGVYNFNNSFLIQNAFYEFLRSKFFNEALLKRAFDMLVSLYLKEGFWDIKVLKQDFEQIKNNGDNSYKLIVTIDEGRRRYLTSVKIDPTSLLRATKGVKAQFIPSFVEGTDKSACVVGFDHLVSQGPFAKFDKKDLRVPFDIGLLKEQREWLMKYFKSKGYVHVDVKPELHENGQNVSLVWNIDTGTLVTFGKTVVLGGGKFFIDHITRELKYKEGDVWDNEKLKASIGKIRSLGMFEHAHLYPYKVEVKEDTKDILLKLQPDDQFEVRFRVGGGLQNVSKEHVWGRGFTYKLGGSFLYRNPFEFYDQFFANFELARSFRNFCVSYARPWIFNMPIKTLFKVYANRYDQPGFVGNKKNLYQVTQDGFLVELRRLFEKFDFSTNIGVEWNKTCIIANMASVAKSIARAINFESNLLGVKVPYIFLEPILVINYLDNKIDPHFGSFTLITLKGMFPLTKKISDALFVRFLIEQSLFYPFSENCIGALRLRFGHIFYQKFKNIMPTERFYLGGAHSIRSYEKDMCPPLGVFSQKTKSLCGCSYAPRGGKTMFNANLELRFPVYKAIGAVLFQDLGTLIGQRFERSNVLAGTGFGLRFDTAVGPIRFDFAFKWRKQKPFERRYAWFLAFGNVF